MICKFTFSGYCNFLGSTASTLVQRSFSYFYVFSRRCCNSASGDGGEPSYLPLGAAGLDEDGEVSDLVRHLVQQDGEGGDGAHGGAHQEGRPHGQAVGEVVDEVGGQVEVARHLDVWGGRGGREASPGQTLGQTLGLPEEGAAAAETRLLTDAE